MFWRMHIVGLALALVFITVSCTDMSTEPAADSESVQKTTLGSSCSDYAVSAQEGEVCALSDPHHHAVNTPIASALPHENNVSSSSVGTSPSEPVNYSHDRNDPIGQHCRNRSIATWMELFVDPVNILWDGWDELAPVRVWAVVYDQYDQPMNGVSVWFSSNRAQFYADEQHQHRLDPAIGITGQGDDADGTATVWLWVPEIWIDPWTLEVTVQVNAGVVGMDDVCPDPVFLFITYDR